MKKAKEKIFRESRVPGSEAEMALREIAERDKGIYTCRSLDWSKNRKGLNGIYASYLQHHGNTRKDSR